MRKKLKACDRAGSVFDRTVCIVSSYGDSPYQSFSTFAGNPYFIDPEVLIKKGYISRKKCDSYDFGNDPERTDYEKIYKSRFRMLREAFKKADPRDKGFLAYEKKNAFWLDDYALYMAVKASFDNKSWQEWEELEAYAHSRGISLVGDIPIYVALDSADAWANPKLFQFDEDLRPIAVAGCPPDAFSADGQLWGNPLYDWERHKKEGFAWWMKRLEHCFDQYDIVRIDHFRGFDEYYSVPYPAKNARKGSWKKGPGYELFKVMKEKLGKREVIAEDLGFLTPSVIRLVKKTGYPGMKVLQFAFDPREESDYLPHNYTANCVVYTGTHDNDTTLHWFETLKEKDRKYAMRYLDMPADIKRGDISWCFIRSALSSVASLVVIPMQDVLSLGGKARMNMPSTLGGNWEWRMKEGAFNKAKKRRLLKMTEIYGRLLRQK